MLVLGVVEVDDWPGCGDVLAVLLVVAAEGDDLAELLIIIAGLGGPHQYNYYSLWSV